MAAKKSTPLYRSAETGKVVTRQFAESNPKTTVKETIVRKPSPSKSRGK